MPVVLPHELVESFVHNNLWPANWEEECGGVRTREFWKHCGEHAAWAADHPATADGRHRPLALYMDDAALSKVTGEKMVIFTMSDVLDWRKNCMETAWPLFLIRDAPRLAGTGLGGSADV